MGRDIDKLDRKVRDMEDEMDRTFRGFLNPQGVFSAFSERIWRPPTDIYDNEDEILIRMEIAGINLDRVDIRFSDNVLKISGERESRRPKGNTRLLLMEINRGRFKRSVILHDKIDTDNISHLFCENIGEFKIEWWNSGNVSWDSDDMLSDPGDYKPKAIKFTFTLYDSKGVFKGGKRFSHIVYIGDN